jgi:hypothetical protein
MADLRWLSDLPPGLIFVIHDDPDPRFSLVRVERPWPWTDSAVAAEPRCLPARFRRLGPSNANGQALGREMSVCSRLVNVEQLLLWPASLTRGTPAMQLSTITDTDFEEFERALADQLSEPTLTRLTRLTRARSKVDDDDPRYDAVLKRVFNLVGQPS